MSGAVAIRAEGLGKRFRLGARERYKALRDRLAGAFRAPFRGGGAATPAEEFWALKDVSFEIAPGEVVGLIGRNGAGKSTLLRVLSRITEPTEGRAEVHGRVSSLLEVGTGFHPELTGRENIFLNGAILGMRRREIERRFDEIVAFAEVERFLDTPVKHYSSGMYVRLAFAVAAHLEPEILIVDEVLAVGDAAFQKKCLGRMDDVAHAGRTVVLVSHNMIAIERLCRRAIRLEAGRVAEATDDVRAAIRNYLFAGGSEPEPPEWTNEGGRFKNPSFFPVRLVLTDAAGARLKMPVSNAAEVHVRIEGRIETADPALSVGYAIYTDEGHLLYWSYFTDGPEDAWPRLGTGDVRLVGRIPSRTLNEGMYRVELIASLHFRQWILEPGVSAPAVRLSIQGGLSDSPHWMIRRPGLLAPVLPWRVER